VVFQQGYCRPVGAALFRQSVLPKPQGRSWADVLGSSPVLQ